MTSMPDEEQLTTAADVQTPSAVLADLVRIVIGCMVRKGRDVAGAHRFAQILARNPNVAAEDLNLLAWFAPAAVLENPALSLLDLVNPAWLSPAMLRRLAVYPTCPNHYRRRLAEWEQQLARASSSCLVRHGVGVRRMVSHYGEYSDGTSNRYASYGLVPCIACECGRIPVPQES